MSFRFRTIRVKTGCHSRLGLVVNDELCNDGDDDSDDTLKDKDPSPARLTTLPVQFGNAAGKETTEGAGEGGS